MIASTIAEFDPYSLWLNVAAADRPLNAYQILGLEPLESDLSRIRTAHERQIAALDRVVNTAERESWDRLQQELLDALTLLLDPARKSVLDASLRRKRGSATVLRSSGSDRPATTICNQCQRENGSERRFCTGCGQSLWDACPKCGAEVATAERFCGACGADVVGTFQRQAAEYQRDFEEAVALAKQHQYEGALARLRGLTTLTDPRHDALASRAVEQTAAIERQRTLEADRARSALERARALAAAHAYERAQQALEDLPEPLWTADHRSLFERARNSRRELLELSGEIRAAIAEKQTANLLPKLARMLGLKPDHKQALQIAGQLRDSVMRTAATRLEQHRYQDAVRLLEQVPALIMTDAVKAQLDQAAELASLWNAIRQGALVEPSLLALADRLCHLAPTNKEAASVRLQLIQRMKSKPVDARLPAPNWAKPPDQNCLGAPVDALAFFHRCPAANDQVASAMAAHPGCCFTALGLALHGLGLADLSCDLTPQDKTGILSRLPALSFGRRAAASCWGLDLNESSLCAIRLARVGKTDARVEQFEFIAHRQTLANVSSEMTRSEIVRETLESFAGRLSDSKGVATCIGLPGHRVLGRFFELPHMPAKKREESIQYEARHQLPIALEELCWSHAVLGDADGKSVDQRPLQVVVQAARDEDVRNCMGKFKAAGIPVTYVQSDCLALHNAIRHELGPTDAQSKAVAVVDIRPGGTNLIVSAPRSLWFRSFGSGDDEFIRALMRELQLTYEQARQTLLAPARAASFVQWMRCIEPIAAQWSGEVQRSLLTSRKSIGNMPLQQVYGLGDQFLTGWGLLRHLRMSA